MKRSFYLRLLVLVAAGAGVTGCYHHPKAIPGKPPGTASPPPPTEHASADHGGGDRPDFAVDTVETQEGKALWYDVPDASLAARRAWPEEMTAASDRLPQNTYVRVTRLDPVKGSDPKPVLVRVTDKSLGRRDALIEVDKDAARELGMVKDGTARVRVETLALKHATAEKPVEKKAGEAGAVPKASEKTGKPAVSAEDEKAAAEKKSGK